MTTSSSTPTTGTTFPLARQQAIENALSAALFFIRANSSPRNLQAATGRAMRAASILKQACTESTKSGRA